MEAIIRCEDLLSEFAEKEKKESADSLGNAHIRTQRCRLPKKIPKFYLSLETYKNEKILLKKMFVC